MKKFRFGTWLVLSAGSLLLLSQALPAENVAANQKNQIKVQLLNHSDETAIGTLELNGEYQLKLGKKDKYGRLLLLMFRCRSNTKPKRKRRPRSLTIPSVGTITNSTTEMEMIGLGS